LGIGHGEIGRRDGKYREQDAPTTSNSLLIAPTPFPVEDYREKNRRERRERRGKR